MDAISQLCERARTWASLRADGELSELESALLDAHLGRCAACRSFAHGFETVAGALRATTLEHPAPLALSLPARRSPALVLRLALTALALAAAAVAVAFAMPQGGQPAPKPVAMVAGVDSPDHLRRLRRASLLEQVRQVPRNRQVPGDV